MKNKKNKVYISGQITGKEEEAKREFKNIELELLSDGYDVINPFDLNHNHNKTWLEYMRVDIIALMGCDYICMIDGWEKSRGAIIEKELAEKLGIKVLLSGY